jgi:hypothetical protein
MKTLIRTSLLLTAALLAGCGTPLLTVSQSRAVPADRLLSGYSALAQPSPAKARVVVIRDEVFASSGAPARLIADGAPVARMATGERVEFYLTGGNHIIGVAPRSYSGTAVSEGSFFFTPGRTSYFRISLGLITVFEIQPSTQLQ